MLVRLSPATAPPRTRARCFARPPRRPPPAPAALLRPARLCRTPRPKCSNILTTTLPSQWRAAPRSPGASVPCLLRTVPARLLFSIPLFSDSDFFDSLVGRLLRCQRCHVTYVVSIKLTKPAASSSVPLASLDQAAAAWQSQNLHP